MKKFLLFNLQIALTRIGVIYKKGNIFRSFSFFNFMKGTAYFLRVKNLDL